MKKTIVAATLIAFIGFPCFLWAQDVKPETKEKEEEIEIKEKGEKGEKFNKKETEEIVIRNKGDKEMNLTVEINGDKIIVNGKPLAEFSDDKITINKRKMIVRDGDRMMAFDFGPGDRSFNMGEDFVRELTGKGPNRAFLGVTTEKTDEGAKITEVIKGSAAEKAGLKKDDVITKIGGKKITEDDGLSELIGDKKPKDVVNVFYKRGGRETSLKVTLGEQKRPSMSYSFNGPGGNMHSFSMPKIAQAPRLQLDGLADVEGFRLNEDLHNGPFAQTFPRPKRLGLKIQDTEEGDNVKVILVEEGSAAEKAGLKKDDIILEIGGNKITSTDDAREQLNQEDQKTSYPVKIKRNGAEMSFDIKIPKKVKTANL